MARVRETGFYVVAMLRDMPMVSCHYDRQDVSLSKLYAFLRKWCGKAKILTSVLVEIRVDLREPFKARVVFVRDRNRSRKWLAFLPTDLQCFKVQS